MSDILNTSEVVDMLEVMFNLCLKRKTEILDKMGINEVEYDFFMFLNSNNTLSIMQIANRLNLAQAKVSRMTDKFIKKQYLKRENQKNDQRSVRIIFTEKGKEMHKYAIENKCMGETRIKSILKDEKYEEFKSLLQQLIEKYNMGKNIEP